MEQKTEALLVKTELLLWLCRKELHRRKVDELRKQCVREQEDVTRVESSLFSKLRRNHDERLEKEKEEYEQARRELEQVEKILAEAEEKIPALKAKLENISSIYKGEEYEDAEKLLFDWCSFMERGYEVIALTNKCLEEGWAERIRSYGNPGNLENCIVFQEEVEELYGIMDGFLSVVGRVRYLPGIRIDDKMLLQRSRRTTYYGGKTLVFLRKGYAAVQIDLHELDFSNLWGGWAVGDALERKLKEVEQLERLFFGIIKEYIALGEEVFRKVKMDTFKVPEQNIFGFEMEK